MQTGLKRSPSRLVFRALVILFLCLMCAYFLVPLLWILATTLRPLSSSFAQPPALFPSSFDFESYRAVFQKVRFDIFLTNSFKVALLSTFLQLLCASMAAFAFARLKFPGKGLMFVLFLSAMMIPAQVLSIPRFLIMSKLRLVDTHAALILPAMFSAMGIFLLRQSMMTISRSYDEAAYMDGASRMYCFLHIIVPMTKPALMVVATQTFILTWNDFYSPLIYINSQRKMTLPLGMTVLKGTLNSGNQAVILAGVVLTLIAPLVFYVVGQRYLIEGITLGGLKG